MAKKQTAVKETVAAPLSGDAKDVHLLIAQAIDKNVNVETMEKLLAMRTQLKSEWARDQFHVALAAFQAACPIIKKAKEVMNKDGKSVRYRYAPLDSIVTQVKDLLKEHGFNYRTDAKIEGRSVEAFCIVTHNAGHSERSSFLVPIDPEAYMSDAQKFAAALTFAKRYAFVNSFGILTADEDTDSVVIASSSPTQGHRRTKAYEETTAAETSTATADLLELSTFLSEHNIPEGFLLRLLQDKKLIDGRTKTVGAIKPGILRRCLDDRSKQGLLSAWKAQQADEEKPNKPQEKPQEKSPFDSGTPEREPSVNGKAKATPPAAEQQRPARRKFSQGGKPRDFLGQHGIDDWRRVKIHFGEKEGTPLGKLSRASLEWWIENWQAKPYKGTWEEDTLLLDAALCLAAEEIDNG
jgi:hypothetical protein